MRIAKPLLLVTTPLGVIGGLHEAYRLAGGLVILMAAMIGMLCVAAVSLVMTVRREQNAEKCAATAAASMRSNCGSP